MKEGSSFCIGTAATTHDGSFNVPLQELYSTKTSVRSISLCPHHASRSNRFLKRLDPTRQRSTLNGKLNIHEITFVLVYKSSILLTDMDACVNSNEESI